MEKKRKVQAKASSDYKKKEAAKPRRAKFTPDSNRLKSGGSVKKMQMGGSYAGKPTASKTSKSSINLGGTKTKSRAGAGIAKRPVKKVSGDGKAGIVLKKKQTGSQS